MTYYDVDKTTPTPSTHTPAQPGYGSVSEYQASGIPWVTGSVVSSPSVVQGYEFPYVTKRIHVRNHASPGTGLRVGFTQAGTTGSNFVLVDGGQTFDVDVRTRCLFVLGNNGSPSYSIFAGLTAIPSKHAPVLTGSSSTAYGSWQGVG